MPSSLIGLSGRRTSPAPNSVSGVTSTPSARSARCRTFTTCAGSRKGLVKPRLGMRRISGICPPSNPRRVEPPVRALWPFWPRPLVFPIPEPGPRPPLRRLRLGRRHRLLPVLHRRHLDEVAHQVDHAAQRRVILLHHDVLMVLEAQRLERAAQRRRLADRRADLLQADLALPRRLLTRIPPADFLAAFASRRVSSHEPSPPGAPCTGSCRPRCPAPWPHVAPWSGAAGHRASPGPYCAGWWTPGSW